MKTRLLAIAISSLAAVAASLPLAAPAKPAGEAVETSELRVGAGESGESLEITGSGASTHQLYFRADGTLSVRFPGARLSMDAAAGALGAQVSDERPDTLVIALDGRHLASLVADEARVRVTLSRSVARMDSEYRIGVGDKLRLTIHGDEEGSDQEVRVVGAGTISVPHIGEVKVLGLTETEVAAAITRRLADGYLRDPQLSLEVLEYQSRWVHVTGQVKDPGRYYLRGATTLVDILAEAGGLSDDAGNEIRIARGSASGQPEQWIRVRRDDLYLTDDPAANPVLRSGDTITVADAQYFFIKGEVKNPGRYAVEDGTTILQAISLAGGFDEFANQKKVELLRQEGDESVRLVINIDRIENRKADDVRVLPGDIINVKTRFL